MSQFATARPHNAYLASPNLDGLLEEVVSRVAERVVELLTSVGEALRQSAARRISSVCARPRSFSDASHNASTTCAAQGGSRRRPRADGPLFADRMLRDSSANVGHDAVTQAHPSCRDL
jgi:hypothetical protein